MHTSGHPTARSATISTPVSWRSASSPQLAPEVERVLVARAHEVVEPLAVEHGQQARVVAGPRAQLPRPRVLLPHLGRGVAARVRQRAAVGDPQVELEVGAAVVVGQRVEVGERPRQLVGGLDRGRAPQREPARLEAVRHGPSALTRGLQVARDRLGLRAREVGKAALERARDPAVEPRLFGRLARRLLQQRVPEHVAHGRRAPAPAQQLRRDELLETLVELARRRSEAAASRSRPNSRPISAPSWATARAASPSRSSRAITES